MHHVRKGVSGRAGLCATRTTPSSPREQQGIVFICIYIGVSLRTLPCTLTRRRFPIFRPKLSTEKPRPSNPPPPPVIHRPRNPLSTSRRFLSLSRRGHPAHSRRLSYATSSRHIRIKSNVFRLNGFVSVVFDYSLFLSPPFPPILLPSTWSKYLL